MKNNHQPAPVEERVVTESLLSVNRDTYRARCITSQAIYLGEPGEWNIEAQDLCVVITFPNGRILDSQNRAWMKGLLSVIPAVVEIPYGYPVSLSSIGAYPRYYIQLPRACSLTLECSIPIGSQ